MHHTISPRWSDIPGNPNHNSRYTVRMTKGQLYPNSNVCSDESCHNIPQYFYRDATWTVPFCAMQVIAVQVVVYAPQWYADDRQVVGEEN